MAQKRREVPAPSEDQSPFPRLQLKISYYWLLLKISKAKFQVPLTAFVASF